MTKYELFSQDKKDVPVYRILFRNTNFSQSGLTTFIDAIQEGEYDEKLVLDPQRTLYITDMGDILVEYTDPTTRNEDIQNFRSVDIKNGFTLQKPDVSGEFEMGDKFYLILGTNFRLEGTSSETLYKGVIVNPGKYIEQGTSSQVIEIKKDKVEKTLENK